MDANAMHLAAFRRHLASINRSDRTQQNYEEAILQLIAHHRGANVMDLRRADVEDYMAAVLARPGRHRVGQTPGHVSSTASNRFRSLRRFYNWAVDEEIIEVSPMVKMTEPTSTEAPVPIVPDDHLRLLLKACGGRDFRARRDTAIIRLFCEPGSPRVAEMAGLLIDDSLDLRRDQVRVHGKGNKVRDIPFGPKTGQALDRYVRVRVHHRLAARPELWIGLRGPMTSSGIEQMLQQRCIEAGIPHVHPHQLRHTAAHDWKLQGGSDEDAMELFGWASADMPLRYGRSARGERAQKAARRTTRADRL